MRISDWSSDVCSSDLLEAAHAAFLLLGHLRVHQAAAGGHPLHAAGDKQALVAVVVLVAHSAVEPVGYGLDAAVRLAGETGEVVLGLVGAELVEQQERRSEGQSGGKEVRRKGRSRRSRD